MLVRFPLRLASLALILGLAACDQNATAPFHADTDTAAARACLARGYPFFRRMYPADAVCLRERQGPEVTDVQAWLDSNADTIATQRARP